MHTFLYILVWSSEGEYADITLLSMHMLRAVHPESRILLLTDPDTSKALHESGHPLLALTDQLVESTVPFQLPSMKSWYLKSRMRNLVDGDFVFLDADTIVRCRLDALFLIDAPIAMAENHSLRYPDNFPDMERIVYERNGWPIPGNGHYLNSGVIFWRDDPQAHRLGEKWAQCWDGSAASGLGYDQPALNRAIETADINVHVLDDRYNAQFKANPSAGADAAIWHFYQTDRRWFPRDWLSMGIKQLNNGQGIDDAFIQKVLNARTPYPITEAGSESDMIAHLLSGKQLDTSAYEQLTGTPLPSTENATVCTIITANYLPYALALLKSVRAFEPNVHFNVLISDKLRHQFSETIKDKNVNFHFADEVCTSRIGQQIQDKYQSTDHDAFRWSCKPLFINHLIWYHNYERVIYFDCDIYIFDAFRFLFDALKTHHVLLTPHWRTREPETDPAEYRTLFSHGLYNAGFIGASSQGTEAMDWWARCCLHSCARGSFEGELHDQSILNLMPVYFEGVHVLRHKGCNVSNWNQHECKRIIQPDGSVKIDNEYPVVFVHFSAGIPRSWDPMLGGYMDRYLAALRQINMIVWDRELERRNPRKDPYIDPKSTLYLKIKKAVVTIRCKWFHQANRHNIAILAQAGTSQQCLGLWLRQVPGSLLSNAPVSDWWKDGIDTLDDKISGYQIHPGKSRLMEDMLKFAMTGQPGDPIHVNWAHWSSIIRIKRMIMNFPEGVLCWPGIAEILGNEYQVIALISHPNLFVQRMMAIVGDGRHLQCMTETRDYMLSNPERPAGLEAMSPAEFAWLIKWCMDMKTLETAAAQGKRIIFLKEEDLMYNTRETMDRLIDQLGWNWKGEIGAHFPVYCKFREQATGDSSDEFPDPKIDGMAVDQTIRSFGISAYTRASDKKMIK